MPLGASEVHFRERTCSVINCLSFGWGQTKFLLNSQLKMPSAQNNMLSQEAQLRVTHSEPQYYMFWNQVFFSITCIIDILSQSI